MSLESLGTIWVCETCMFIHANGVDLRYDSLHGMEYDPETNPSPEPEPWGRMPEYAAMGMYYEEHECGKTDENRDFECDCETREFSRSSCDGCGSTLHGTRHAFTMFARA